MSTYSYSQAESIVQEAFKSRGFTSVTDDQKLSVLGFNAKSDLLGLLDSVNLAIPNKAHRLPISATDNWTTVKDVVVSVENAP